MAFRIFAVLPVVSQFEKLAVKNQNQLILGEP
jgi:hypothetical protein